MTKKLTRGQRLLSSAKQASAIAKGEIVKAPRSSGALDVKAIREATGLTQAEFAKKYRFSLARIRDWEQGRSQPDAAMQTYLRSISTDKSKPEARPPGIRRVRISAQMLEYWSGSRQAQEDLPILVRRLIGRTAPVTAVAVPGGDEVSRSGWDGIVEASKATPWVPEGRSFWELGTSSKPHIKADDDFTKRTNEISEADRANATFVFVTPRIWPKKDQWLAKAELNSGWKQVRVYDALDLEAWLELSPASSIWFGETIGMSGSGVASVEEVWRSWSQQTDPSLTVESMLTHRDEAAKAVVKALLSDQMTHSIRADSVDEAVAFVCGTILQTGSTQHQSQTLVVTSADGWQFIDANEEIGVAIVARPEFARDRAPNERVKIFIPFATSDRGAYFRGRAASAAEDASIIVERLRADEFEKAVVKLGVDSADAQRLARLTSRSWTVFRRLRANNDAIAKPAWLDHPAAKALSTLCLIGAWSAGRAGDRAVVERIAGRPYEDLEKDLRVLSLLDDAPVIAIGAVWWAKSPLELLHLMGERISREELCRFFDTCTALLKKPDPVLELPEDDRWKAAIFNKVREESGLVFDSICDSLIKLAVLGPDVDNLAVNSISTRVGALVRDLLDGADRERWLSLYSVLAELAEAAPSEFLNAVENSLYEPGFGAGCLIAETTDTGFIGSRCWHADLLRALEVLAWRPQNLPRIVDILVRLTKVPGGGRWAKTPSNTLLSLFRSWYPQTSAPIERRVQLLDRVIQNDNGVGWQLLCGLALTGHDSASPNARPKWRDDDAGVGEGVSQREMHLMLSAAGARLIALAEGRPLRLGTLVEGFDQFDTDWRREIVKLVLDYASDDHPDEERAELQGYIRKYLSWSQRRGSERDAERDALTEAQEALKPRDLLVKHAWLFNDFWVELPEGEEEDDDTSSQNKARKIEALRSDAVKEVFETGGWEAIDSLIARAGEARTVGWVMAQLFPSPPRMFEWLSHRRAGMEQRSQAWWALNGLTGRAPLECRLELLELVISEGRNSWSQSELVHVLLSFPPDMKTFEQLGRIGSDAAASYWKLFIPWLNGDDAAELNLVGTKLLEVGRPRSAFSATRLYSEKLDPALLYKMLEGMRTIDEPEAQLPDRWHISQAFDRLEKSGEIEEQDLGRLEFAFIRLLERSQRGSKTVSKWIASNPAIFYELISTVFKERHKPRAEVEPDERRQEMAHNAWSALHHCKRIPGEQEDGSVDPAALQAWADVARKLCREGDREAIGDQTIGQILANAAVGTDGVWPAEGVRQLLDSPDGEEIRKGLVVGTMNNRGVTSRSYDEGGSQERVLAKRYESYADALADYPRLADAIRKLQKHYEDDALREDLDANLRIEGR